MHVYVCIHVCVYMNAHTVINTHIHVLTERGIDIVYMHTNQFLCVLNFGVWLFHV